MRGKGRFRRGWGFRGAFCWYRRSGRFTGNGRGRGNGRFGRSGRNRRTFGWDGRGRGMSGTL